MSTQGPKLAQFSGHKGCIYSIIQGINPGEFISAGGDGFVVQWHVNEPDKGKLLAQVQGSIYAMCLLPEQQCLLIACNRDGLHLLDLQAEKEIWNLPTPNQVWFRALWDGQKIRLAGSKGSVLQIRLEDKKSNSILLGAEDNRALAIGPKRDWVAFGNSGGQIFLNHLGTQNLFEKKEAHRGTIYAIQFFPFENQLITAGKDAKIKKWAFNNEGQIELLEETAAHLFGIHDLVLHPSKPILASCSMDKTIKIWDAENLKLLRVLDKARHAGHGHSINQILWLSEPELLLSCSDDRTITAWDIFA